MSSTDVTKPLMGVVIGTEEEGIGEAVRVMIATAFGVERDVRCTIKPSGREIREAVSLYDIELVLLLVNTMRPDGQVADRFEEIIELVKELRQTTHAAMIVGTTCHPVGFLTRVEQAGAEGLLNVPVEASAMKETIENAFEGRRLSSVAEGRATELQRKREALRPRVVLLDDEPIVLEFISQVVRRCWRHATIVAWKDSHAAWAELQQRPPDLFITDLAHGGIDGYDLLERLGALEVRYPIAVVSGHLPMLEAEARAAAGRKLRVGYWVKPFRLEELAEGIAALLEGEPS